LTIIISLSIEEEVKAIESQELTSFLTEPMAPALEWKELEESFTVLIVVMVLILHFF
jgi:hypothetical protein